MSHSLHPHPPVELGSPVLTEVSDGYYAYTQPDGSWWINNTGFAIGRRGVISIDACATEARTYLDALRLVTSKPVTKQGKAAGLSSLELGRQVDLGEFSEWLDSERVVGNLHRAYAELGGTQNGAQIDVATALSDMVASTAADH